MGMWVLQVLQIYILEFFNQKLIHSDILNIIESFYRSNLHQHIFYIRFISLCKSFPTGRECTFLFDSYNNNFSRNTHTLSQLPNSEYQQGNVGNSQLFYLNNSHLQRCKFGIFVEFHYRNFHQGNSNMYNFHNQDIIILNMLYIFLLHCRILDLLGSYHRLFFSCYRMFLQDNLNTFQLQC